jgi:dGTPase
MSKLATLSRNSKGRQHPENHCEIRTDFQRDRDRIIHSKAFRRLKHKTQVFLSPEGDHYRTRLTHTLEVSQISRTIARALQLNEDLTEAIALGHDLGHTPFGHSGESELNLIHKPDGFQHNRQSLRIVEYLERTSKPYKGLNLTFEVRDGILNHNGPVKPATLEGQIVKLCDRIAYINHDIDDALRAGVLHFEELPKSAIDHLGQTHSARIGLMIRDVIDHSEELDSIMMSRETWDQTNILRNFMFEHVYLNINAKSEEGRAKHIIRALYYYFLEYPEKMSLERYQDYEDGMNKEAVKDYIAGMSDRYAVGLYKDMFIPKFWK